MVLDEIIVKKTHKIRFTLILRLRGTISNTAPAKSLEEANIIYVSS